MIRISKHKLKIIIVFATMFLTVAILLLLIFLHGKKTYTVTFELDGGTLISGSLVQTVTRGENASPPSVTKDGCYFHSWRGSYRQITHDVTIEAVWEYETTPGIVYSENENSNFTEISGAYKYLSGEVYIGAYHGGKKLLGIKESAFSGCVDITKVYLLDGLITIEKGAFENCTGLLEINIPETVTRIGDNAFSGCESLEVLVLNEGLREIGAGAFANCTSLKEVVIPSTVAKIDESAFDGCEDIVIKYAEAEENAEGAEDSEDEKDEEEEK